MSYKHMNFWGHIETKARKLPLIKASQLGKWEHKDDSVHILLCQRTAFSVHRRGLHGLLVHELLAAVQISNKLHLSDTKAFHFPLRENEEECFDSFILLWVSFKMFVLSTQRPNLLSENRLITSVRTCRTCCWVWNTHKPTYQRPPSPQTHLLSTCF